MSKKKKPIGEIVAGIAIVSVGIGIAAISLNNSDPENIFLVFLAVPVVIIGSIVLFSKNATKTGDQIIHTISEFLFKF